MTPAPPLPASATETLRDGGLGPAVWLLHRGIVECANHESRRIAPHRAARPRRGQVFGIPGDFVLAFFKVVEESGILPLYTLSHEPSVGFAADAAARVAGGPGVAVVTYGAGALNLVNPVAAAYAEKSPLVVISGAPGQPRVAAGCCCITR